MPLGDEKAVPEGNGETVVYGNSVAVRQNNSGVIRKTKGTTNNYPPFLLSSNISTGIGYPNCQIILIGRSLS